MLKIILDEWRDWRIGKISFGRKFPNSAIFFLRNLFDRDRYVTGSFVHIFSSSLASFSPFLATPECLRRANPFVWEKTRPPDDGRFLSLLSFLFLCFFAESSFRLIYIISVMTRCVTQLVNGPVFGYARKTQARFRPIRLRFSYSTSCHYY